jgi:hypothetical protein
MKGGFLDGLAYLNGLALPEQPSFESGGMRIEHEG